MATWVASFHIHRGSIDLKLFISAVAVSFPASLLAHPTVTPAANEQFEADHEKIHRYRAALMERIVSQYYFAGINLPPLFLMVTSK